METEKLSFKLDVFEGPLDLLLHLIAKDKVDIYDIPIESITRQYFAYLNTVKEFDMEVGSEFLVMAARLLYIKSKMLLPQEKIETEDKVDPRAELVAKLLDYKAYKDLAEFLRQKEHALHRLPRRPALCEHQGRYGKRPDQDRGRSRERHDAVQLHCGGKATAEAGGGRQGHRVRIPL